MWIAIRRGAVVPISGAINRLGFEIQFQLFVGRPGAVTSSSHQTVDRFIGNAMKRRLILQLIPVKVIWFPVDFAANTPHFNSLPSNKWSLTWQCMGTRSRASAVLLPAVVNSHLNAFISSLSKQIERFALAYGSRNAHLRLSVCSHSPLRGMSRVQHLLPDRRKPLQKWCIYRSDRGKLS